MVRTGCWHGSVVNRGHHAATVPLCPVTTRHTPFEREFHDTTTPSGWPRHDALTQRAPWTQMRAAQQRQMWECPVLSEEVRTQYRTEASTPPSVDTAANRTNCGRFRSSCCVCEKSSQKVLPHGKLCTQRVVLPSPTKQLPQACCRKDAVMINLAQ